jgi:hypothetical protein
MLFNNAKVDTILNVVLSRNLMIMMLFLYNKRSLKSARLCQTNQKKLMVEKKIKTDITKKY